MLYQRGLDAEQRGRLREAAIAFQRTTHYVPSFRDADARYAVPRRRDGPSGRDAL